MGRDNSSNTHGGEGTPPPTYQLDDLRLPALPPPAYGLGGALPGDDDPQSVVIQIDTTPPGGTNTTDTTRLNSTTTQTSTTSRATSETQRSSKQDTPQRSIRHACCVILTILIAVGFIGGMTYCGYMLDQSEAKKTHKKSKGPWERYRRDWEQYENAQKPYEIDWKAYEKDWRRQFEHDWESGGWRQYKNDWDLYEKAWRRRYERDWHQRQQRPQRGSSSSSWDDPLGS